MPRVTIVIPVYQGEKYIKRVIDSILAQTWKDYEVVIVDDGSTDSSPGLCDEIAKENEQIQIIHQSHKGLSHARNVGTAAGTGELVTYIDVDDYVEPYYLEFLVKAIDESNAEFACARRDRIVEDNIQLIDRPQFKWEIWTQKEALAGIMTSSKTTVSSWNKLAPRSWYLDEPFPEGKLYEDLYNTYKIILKTEKIVFVDAVLYHYVMNAGSITGRAIPSKKQCLDHYNALWVCVKDSVNRYPELKADADVLLARDFMDIYLVSLRCEDPYDSMIEDLRRKVLKWFKNFGFHTARNKNAPKEVRMRIWLMTLSPRLYRFAFYKGIKFKGKALG